MTMANVKIKARQWRKLLCGCTVARKAYDFNEKANDTIVKKRNERRNTICNDINQKYINHRKQKRKKRNIGNNTKAQSLSASANILSTYLRVIANGESQLMANGSQPYPAVNESSVSMCGQPVRANGMCVASWKRKKIMTKTRKRKYCRS